MIWGGCSARGQTQLVVLNESQGSSNYLETLQNAMLPYTAAKHSEGFIFQCDNASMNIRRVTKEWFTSQNISLLDWTPKSPDPNPFENLWGILAHKVHGEGKEYKKKAELQ